MKSWKTTVCGVLTLIAALAPIWAPPETSRKIQQSAMLVVGCGLLAAKDSNVTGK
jgi:hypothetical protein